jgi:hypothetical protein
MNNRGRRGNNNGRRNAAINQNLGVKLRALHDKVNGHSYKPRPDPTSFVTVPWNTWTYSATGTIAASSANPPVITPYTTLLGNIANQIVGANGIGAVAPEIKVLRAASWITSSQTSGLTVPKGTTTFYEVAGYDQTNKSKRETITDQGTLNMPATFGYVYPLVDQKEILDPSVTANQPVLATTTDALTSGQSIPVNHRVYVLWRAKNALFSESEQNLD